MSTFELVLFWIRGRELVWNVIRHLKLLLESLVLLLGIVGHLMQNRRFSHLIARLERP